MKKVYLSPAFEYVCLDSSDIVTESIGETIVSDFETEKAYDIFW